MPYTVEISFAAVPDNDDDDDDVVIISSFSLVLSSLSFKSAVAI